MKIELIHGQKEINLFNSLLNIHHTELDLPSNFVDLPENISLHDMSLRITEILNIEGDKNRKRVEIFREIRSRLEIVHSIVNNLNERLKIKLKSKLNFIKLQNLLRNLGYHYQFLRLFSLTPSQNFDPLF